MPCGEYFTSQSSRMGVTRWRIQRVVLVGGIPVMLLLPSVLPPGWLSMAVGIFIMAIAVLGLNVMLGYVGEIVLAQGAFMAIGAYTTSRLLGTGVGLIPAILVGGVLTALVALIFALPSARVKGFYIAITTLALQFISDWFFTTSAMEFIHGGQAQIISSEVTLVGDFLAISGALDKYYLGLAALAVFALVSFNLKRTAIGRMMRAVNENHTAAAVLGINVHATKLIAYSIGGFMVGVAGGLYAFHQGFISAEFFTLSMTIDHYVMLLFGGLGYIWGAVLGTGIVTVLQEILRSIMPFIAAMIPGVELSVGPMRLILFGTIVIVVLAVEPKGFISILGTIKEYFRKWPYAY